MIGKMEYILIAVVDSFRIQYSILNTQNLGRRGFQVFLVLFMFLNITATAQSLPVTLQPVEEAYRRAQLDGKLDSSVSFAIRPLIPAKAFTNDSVHNDLSKWIDYTGLKSANGKFGIGLLPLTWNQQYNSKVPYGWNDGAMIPARGYQTLVSGGVYAKVGPLSFQLKPEFVFAENLEFEGFTSLQPYNYNIDLPGRFGSGSYSEINWGQSSIRLNLGPVSLGISNENLWWGPGIRNSILMGNSATGFKHITFNTTKPLKTSVGSFEVQLIGGKLEGSKYTLPSLNKRPEWRYLSAANISYQPKWIPGLFFGLTRSFQAYHTDLNRFADYIPLFTPYQKVNTDDGDPFDRDQLTSIYSRWLFERAKAEIYFEYGVNDNAYNLRDFIMSPEHARAYLFGFRKLLPFRQSAVEQLQVSAEITQLSQSIDRLVRDAGTYYIHGTVLHGYTHKGEVLGAGIGPGGNLQSVDLSWVKGIKRIGFQVERFVHNNDHYDVAIGDLDGQSRRWVDFGFAALGTWDFNHLLLNVKLQGIQSLNYQWQLKDYTPGTYYIPENDLFNFHGEIGLTYRF